MGYDGRRPTHPEDCLGYSCHGGGAGYRLWDVPLAAVSTRARGTVPTLRDDAATSMGYVYSDRAHRSHRLLVVVVRSRVEPRGYNQYQYQYQYDGRLGYYPQEFRQHDVFICPTSRESSE